MLSIWDLWSLQSSGMLLGTTGSYSPHQSLRCTSSISSEGATLSQQWASCGAEVDDRWLFWPYRAVQLLSVRPHVGCCVSATTANWYYWTAMEGSPQHLQKWPGTHWQRSGRKQNKGQTCAIWHGLILSACKAGWELQKCCIDLCTYVPWIINGNFNLCEFLKCLLPFELSFSLVFAFVKT
jgi:hypothetical protein